MEKIILKLEVDKHHKNIVKVYPATPEPKEYEQDSEEDIDTGFDNDNAYEEEQEDMGPTIGIHEPPSFKDNSVYEFDIKDLKSINSNIKNNFHFHYVTAPSPCYVELKDVTSLARGLKLDDESVLYHIREACRYADFIIRRYNNKAMPHEQITLEKETIIQDYYEIYMFIRYKALRDCLLEFYIKEAAKPDSIKNQTGDLLYEHDFDLTRIKDLLDKIEDEYDDLEREFITVTAAPRQILRGKYSYNKYYPTHLSSSGYGRDKTPVGFDIYGNHTSCNKGCR